MPKDFKSDGCTLSPDGSWGSCCRIHDYARSDDLVTNKEADKMLFDCMRERSNIFLALLYWFWVRVQSVTGMQPVGLAMFVVLCLVLFGLIHYG